MVANCSLVPIDYQNNNTVFLYTFEVSDASMCGYINYHIIMFITCLLLMLSCCICLPCSGSKKLWVLLCFACLLLGFEGFPLLIFVLIMYCVSEERTRIAAYEVREESATTIPTSVVVVDGGRVRQADSNPPIPSAPSRPASPSAAVPTNDDGEGVHVARLVGGLTALLVATRIEPRHLQANEKKAKKIATFRT